MEAVWRIGSEVVAEAGPRFQLAEMTGYFRARAAERFPAVRHSEEYRRMYSPSYRVIRIPFRGGGVTSTSDLVLVGM